MPEGHTLHRLARLHQQCFAGEPVQVSSPQGRFGDGAAQVSGRVLLSTDAWGKHLFHAYEGGLHVHVHLGLYGTFVEQPTPVGEPVGQVRMRLVGSRWGADLRGPTACEVLTTAEVERFVERLGPDPLRADADPTQVLRRIQRSASPVGVLLMNQQVIAGVGNVYRAELLFRHRISPWREGRAVSDTLWQALWADLVELMGVGVEQGRMITVRAEHDCGDPPYEPGRPRTYVYRRAGRPCRICATPIAHANLQGRNLFWCPGCQPD